MILLERHFLMKCATAHLPGVVVTKSMPVLIN